MCLKDMFLLLLSLLGIYEVKLIRVVLLVGSPCPESFERLPESDIVAGERESVRSKKAAKTLIHITIIKLNSHRWRRHLNETRQTFQMLSKLLCQKIIPLLLRCVHSTACLVSKVASDLRLGSISATLYKRFCLEDLSFGLWLPKQLLQRVLKDCLGFT